MSGVSWRGRDLRAPLSGSSDSRMQSRRPDFHLRRFPAFQTGSPEDRGALDTHRYIVRTPRCALASVYRDWLRETPKNLPGAEGKNALNPLNGRHLRPVYQYSVLLFQSRLSPRKFILSFLDSYLCVPNPVSGFLSPGSDTPLWVFHRWFPGIPLLKVIFRSEPPKSSPCIFKSLPPDPTPLSAEPKVSLPGSGGLPLEPRGCSFGS